MTGLTVWRGVNIWSDVLEKIAVFISMVFPCGSATVRSCCDDTQLPLQVKGIIADCGYSSGWEQIGHVLGSSCHMPSFPMLYMYNSVCRIVGGYNLKDIRPIDSVTRSRVPVLFIHGDADNYVPTTMVYKLYNAAAKAKKA